MTVFLESRMDWVLEGNDTVNLAASYTPDTSSSMTYNSASGSAVPVVNKITPTVTVTPSSSSIMTAQSRTGSPV